MSGQRAEPANLQKSRPGIPIQIESELDEKFTKQKFEDN
jgi:hypothetical protein